MPRRGKRRHLADSLTLALAPRDLKALDERCTAAGESRSKYLRDLVSAWLVNNPSGPRPEIGPGGRNYAVVKFNCTTQMYDDVARLATDKRVSVSQELRCMIVANIRSDLDTYPQQETLATAV